MHYVYALFRPDGTPCYIGKGSGKRVYRHMDAARRGKRGHLYSLIRQAGGEVPSIILHSGLDEDTAYSYEEALIRAIGIKRDGGPLVNHGYGGNGGPKGVIHDEAFRRRRSEAAAAMWTPQMRVEMSERMKGNDRKKGKQNSELWRALTSERMKGNTHTLGFKHSEEAKAKISAARKGKPKSEETKAKMKASAQRRSAERRALLAEHEQ